MDFAQLIQEGGPTVQWIIMLAPLGGIAAGVHVWAPKRWSRWTTVAAIALTLAIGVFGTLQGRSRTDDYLLTEDRYSADEREEIRDQGYQEALRPIQFAVVVAGALAVVLVIGELRRRRRR